MVSLRDFGLLSWLLWTCVSDREERSLVDFVHSALSAVGEVRSKLKAELGWQ